MGIKKLISSLLLLGMAGFSQTASSDLLLDEHCVVNVLNRTIQVAECGNWEMPNVPSTMGKIRARAICKRDGETTTGITPYFEVNNNSNTEVPSFSESNEQMSSSSSSGGFTFSINEDFHLDDEFLLNGFHIPFYRKVGDYEVEALTANDRAGLNISSSNPDIVEVDGLNLIPKQSGSVIITARIDGNVVVKRVNVALGGDDTDGDGIPDSWEQEHGMNPNDIVDGYEDFDSDGLSNLEEYQKGSDIYKEDTDGDGLSDLQEVEAGTELTLFDTDGDGLSDRIELELGSDPLNTSDAPYAEALVGMYVLPGTMLKLSVDAIDTENSIQLRVVGQLYDGSEMDLTPTQFGTHYETTALDIFMGGPGEDGKLFGAMVDEPSTSPSLLKVSNDYVGQSIDIEVTVEQFSPVGLSSHNLSIYARSIDKAGKYAYIVGDEGLEIVNVSNPLFPTTMGTLLSRFTGRDVKALGDFLYVSAKEGFYVVSVANPTTPQIAGSLSSQIGYQGIALGNGLIYLAKGAAGIEIVDISKPHAPFSIATMGFDFDVKDVALNDQLLAVLGSKTLEFVDVSNPEAPIKLGKIAIGGIGGTHIAMKEAMAYVVHPQGYFVIDATDPMTPKLVGNGGIFAGVDLTLVDGFAFFAAEGVRQFPHVVPYANIKDPVNSFYQGAIDLTDLDPREVVAKGIASDSSNLYTVGANKLFIAQYRGEVDNKGVKPEVYIESLSDQKVVEETQFSVTAVANDDVAVARVEFWQDGVLLGADSSAPYQYLFTAPKEANVAGGVTRVEVIAYDFGGNQESDFIDVVIQPDSDGDGLGDQEEWEIYHTQINNPDSDGDTLSDGYEIEIGTDPNLADSDGDTDPLLDGSGDNNDATELLHGTDPTNPDRLAPMVVRTTPEADATDVLRNQNISVVFDTPMDPESFAGTSVILTNVDTGASHLGEASLGRSNTVIYFALASVLDGGTHYRLTINGLKDEAGNTMTQAYELSFQTGIYTDTAAPAVSKWQPANYSGYAPINVIPTVTFNEAIDPNSVTHDNIALIDNTTNQNVAITLSLSIDGTRVVLTPSMLLDRNTRYTLQVKGIKDQFGNTMSGMTSAWFETDIKSDTVAPQLNVTTLDMNQTSYPTDIVLKAQFSERINSGAIEGIKLLDPNGNEVAVSYYVMQGNTVVGIKPQGSLSLLPNSTYTFVVSGVRDLAGNEAMAYQQSFLTGSGKGSSAKVYVTNDTLPLKTSYVTMPLNGRFKMSFSGQVDPASIQHYDVNLRDTTLNSYVEGHLVLSEDATVLEFIPDEPLVAGHDYHFSAAGGSYNIMKPNALTGAYGVNRSFTALDEIDQQGPTLVASSIPQGAVNVTRNFDMVLKFDEYLSRYCATTAAFKLTSAQGKVIPINVTESGTQYTIEPTSYIYNVTEGDYTLTISGLCDAVGNQAPLQTISFSVANTTDSSGPTLLSISPADGETGVATNRVITATFSDPVADFIYPPYFYYDGPDGSRHTAGGKWSVNGNTVTFTPAQALVPGSVYYVNFFNRVKNYSGYFNTISPMQFTTDPITDHTAPTIVNVTPQAGSVNIVLRPQIVVAFSEPMSSATLRKENFGFYANGEMIDATLLVSSTGKLVTVEPKSNLPAASVVSLVVSDQLTDMAGNPLAPLVHTFTTEVGLGGVGSPSIIRQIPEAGSSYASQLNEILLYSTHKLRASTVADSLVVLENGIELNGTAELLADGYTIRFSKATPFAQGAQIEIYVADTLQSELGRDANGYYGFFSTASNDPQKGVLPTVDRFFPDGKHLVPVNTKLFARFSEPLDTTQMLSDAQVALVQINGTENIEVTGLTIERFEDGRSIMVTPPPLQPGKDYRFVVVGVMDDDQEISGAYSVDFTTQNEALIDNVGPDITFSYPKNGQQQVPLNTRYMVSYSEPVNAILFDSDFGKRVNMLFSEDNTSVRYQYRGMLPARTTLNERLSALADMAGNPSQALDNIFTTGGSVDVIPPDASLLATNPNQLIVWSYGEVIDPTQVTAEAYKITGNWGGAPALDTEIYYEGDRVRVVPVTALNPGMKYRFYFPYNAMDMAGNRDMGLSADTTYSVTRTVPDGVDIDPPVVEAISFESTPLNVAINAKISIRFNEVLTMVGMEGIQILDSQGKPVNVSKRLDFNTYGSGTVLTLSPTVLLVPNANYTLVLSGVTDNSGNEMVEEQHSFTTGDRADITGAQFVKAFVPFDSSKRATELVAVDTVLSVTFDEPLDATSINQGPTSVNLWDFTDVAIEYPVHTELSADGLTMFIRLDDRTQLEPGRKYQLRLTYSYYGELLKDVAGNTVTGKPSYIAFETQL